MRARKRMIASYFSLSFSLSLCLHTKCLMFPEQQQQQKKKVRLFVCCFCERMTRVCKCVGVDVREKKSERGKGHKKQRNKCKRIEK